MPVINKHFTLGNDKIIVTITNTIEKFSWSMTINGDKSITSTYYEGILEYKGYCLATAYWQGTFPEFIPFKIQEAHPHIQATID